MCGSYFPTVHYNRWCMAKTWSYVMQAISCVDRIELKCRYMLKVELTFRWLKFSLVLFEYTD
jgi:hypothetical protein